MKADSDKADADVKKAAADKAKADATLLVFLRQRMPLNLPRQRTRNVRPDSRYQGNIKTPPTEPGQIPCVPEAAETPGRAQGESEEKGKTPATEAHPAGPPETPSAASGTPTPPKTPPPLQPGQRPGSQTPAPPQSAPGKPQEPPKRGSTVEGTYGKDGVGINYDTGKIIEGIGKYWG